MLNKTSRNEARKVRHRRVRTRIYGTSDRPRLNVFRSNKHIYAQVINDVDGRTVAAASTLDPDLRGRIEQSGNAEAAKLVGELLAKRALALGIDQVVFDRGGYLYHGRVAALAEGARSAGLHF